MDSSPSRGSFRSLPEMFFQRAAELADQPRYREFRDGAWVEARWQEVDQSIRELAAGLIDLGVKPGERLAIFAATSPRWIEADLAIQSAGGVTIPIYQSSLANEAGFILIDSDAHVVLCDGPKTMARVREAIAHGVELDDGSRAAPRIDHIILFEGAPDAADVLTLEQVRARGRASSTALAEMHRRIDSLARDQVATIVYTSGTTGSPKGVVQTHHNHLSMIEMSASLGLVRRGEVDFFFLPLAHSFARMISYYGLYVGSVTAFARGIDTLAADIGATRPHVIPAVPRIYEKIFARIQSTAEAGGAVKRQLFDWALQVGRRRSAHLQAREAPPFLLELEYWVADRLVFKRIRDLLGGNVRLLISGASPLAREIMEFFHAAGLLILEGYGLTETTPGLTINRPDAFKFGTVGLPFDEVEIKLAPDGEIFARGPNVAQGYYNRPEATAEAWDAEGWFHTGDIGEIDAEGFLRITDRKKDLIKTSGGKYVAPQKIENLLKTQPHISQAVVIGDNRKYCTALLTLDPDAVPHLAERAGCAPEAAAVATNPGVLKIIEEEVGEVNAKLASFESIKYFRVLPAELSEQAGELTPSLKIKRKVVASRYAPVIDEMYR